MIGYEYPWMEQIVNKANSLMYITDRINDYSIVFKKRCPFNGNITFNFYWSKRTVSALHKKFTVQTTLDHPKGRKQLIRKDLNIEEAIRLLSDPRAHTGQGYFKKN